VAWHQSTDEFSFSVTTPVAVSNTKRGILSVVAKIFDPFGLIAPVATYAKQIIQDIWISGLDWDQPISCEQRARWEKFLRELECLNQIRIPRFLGTSPGSSVQIHGFCDASSKSYGAVAYTLVDSTVTLSWIHSHPIVGRFL
jgi:Pao retrotransposon peptidase